MEITMIRHGMTRGNREHRYVGITDEPLLEEGKERLRAIRLEQPEIVFVSPMKRCVETAEILYPEAEKIPVEQFREMDFGIAEYKTFEQLDGTEAFRQFVDSSGDSGFPEGETKLQFQQRVCSGMDRVLECCPEKFAIVAHGGTIMAILDRYSHPHEDYYVWHTDNGCGFAMHGERKGSEWILTEIRPVPEKE